MKKAELEAQVEEQRQQIGRLERRWQAEQDHWSRVSTEHNAMMHMLDDLFSLKVGAKDFEQDTPLWDVTDSATGEALVYHEKDIASAYRRAIEHKYQQ